MDTSGEIQDDSQGYTIGIETMARPRKPPHAKQDKPKEKVTLGDTAGMKHALDSAAAEIVLSQGHSEDKFVVYVKLGLGLVAILLALLAQFYPGKLKDNWWLIFSCVVGYTTCTGGLSIFCSLKEGNGILFTKTRAVSGMALKVSSTMPRFTDIYTLKIEAVDKKEHIVRKPVESSKSVGNYFHSDGYLDRAPFEADVRKLLHQFEQKD